MLVSAPSVPSTSPLFCISMVVRGISSGGVCLSSMSVSSHPSIRLMLSFSCEVKGNIKLASWCLAYWHLCSPSMSDPSIRLMLLSSVDVEEHPNTNYLILCLIHGCLSLGYTTADIVIPYSHLHGRNLGNDTYILDASWCSAQCVSSSQFRSISVP